MITNDEIKILEKLLEALYRDLEHSQEITHSNVAIAEVCFKYVTQMRKDMEPR